MNGGPVPHNYLCHRRQLERFGNTLHSALTYLTLRSLIGNMSSLEQKKHTVAPNVLGRQDLTKSHTEGGLAWQSASPSNNRHIDIVYLWVDGADPHWQAKRNNAFSAWENRHPGELAVYGNVLGRYRDSGELRCNLRALERFFPDHGHIYIVTDGQTPAWLCRGQGLTIIDHQDLIPETALPVYDSGHIESYIHRIPGLSEKFIYLNDDVFFGAPVDAKHWFGSHLTVAMEAAPAPQYDDPRPNETAPVNASNMSARWLQSRYPDYRHDSRLCSHAPRPMLRSAMFELERVAADLFGQVRSTTFRSWRIPSIVSVLLPRWMSYVGLANKITLDPLHICTGDDDAERLFTFLEANFGNLPFFCINDTCDNAPADDPRLLRAARVMESLLPLPSPFELV